MSKKISNDGAHEIKMQLKSTIESIANIVEKMDNGKGLKSIQPQLEHVFKILLDIENNWEKID